MCIKEFKDIKIFMEVSNKIYNINHPHILIDYRGVNAKISLDLSMIQGRLPADVKLFIINWAFKNKKDLMNKWEVLASLRKNKVT